MATPAEQIEEERVALYLKIRGALTRIKVVFKFQGLAQEAGIEPSVVYKILDRPHGTTRTEQLRAVEAVLRNYGIL